MRCPLTQTPTRAARVCLRAANLAIVGAGFPGIGARVVRAVYQGGHFRIEAELDHADGVLVHMAVAEPSQLAPGSAIRIGIDDGWVLPEAGEIVDSTTSESADSRRFDGGKVATGADG
jgi:hypothetical protein